MNDTSDAELTMREEQWMLSNELLNADVPEPPIVTAFKLLDESRWEQFRAAISDNAALRFFNPELREFSCAAGWEALSEECGITPYGACWRIDATLPEPARQFCRDLRALVDSEATDTADSARYFELSDVTLATLVVDHRKNCLTPYFGNALDSRFRMAMDLQLARGLTRYNLNDGITLIT